jgi:virulence-associated protein VapD
MTVELEQVIRTEADRSFHAGVRGRGTVYAIAFDLDTEQLKSGYRTDSYPNAYGEIRATLEALGFDHQQGSVYFGNSTRTAVDCVLAVQMLAYKYPWLGAAVKDIRMLRIEDDNDLKPAIQAVQATPPTT